MRPDERDLTPEETRIQEAVRALPGVTADSAFRERLKADFVAGRPMGVVTPIGRPERISRWSPPRVLASLAAAAMLLIAFLVGNRGPALEFAGVTGEGRVVVDGRVYEADDSDGLAGAIRPGARVEVPEGVSVAMSVPGKLVVEIEAGTATVPGSPGRWVGKSAECNLEFGEIRVLTGATFGGDRLVITTPDGMIRVTGTLVSAVRDEGGTCVCVRHGVAYVGRDEADLRPIPPGKRLVLYADRRAPLFTEIAPPHEAHLLDFEARRGDLVR